MVIAALVCLASFSAFWVAQRLAGVTLLDVMVYRAEGWTVRNGGDLYAMKATVAQLPTTYPPFAALLFTPLTLLGVPEMRTFATGFNLALVLGVVYLCLRLVGVERRSRRLMVALWVAALLVWCEPVWTTLRYGQINLLLALLVLWDLTRRPGNRWAGIGIGVATAVKLTPALFAVMLALAGLVQAVRLARSCASWWNPWLRQATVATGTFLLVTAASWLILPYDSKRFWTEMVFAASRPGQAEDTANQSLRGVLARLLHTPDPGITYAIVAALVAVAGLTVAVFSLLRARAAWAVVSCAVTALLVSPISWSHHWVWVVPLLILLGAEARRTGSGRLRAAAIGTGVLFFSFALWWVPHAGTSATVRPELDQNAWQFLLSAGYTLAGLAFLALAARRLLRAQQSAPIGPQRSQAVANE
ncbi:glycosyltransferase 87 family protein [Streptomyces boluensis]|uniref:glycosyltransferase 87 family protein n=1 Tax=Streptomyces boluensis TaxID=1775135 RepID=UPI001FE8DE8A|nr:glycosyltransferase 87 family protein [Streptomyces boluensis]